MQVQSFSEYMDRISFLPSFEWIRCTDDIRINKFSFCFSPDSFSHEYKQKCVTYYWPNRPEDGWLRIIYQMSKTFHMEVVYSAWMVQDTLHSHFIGYCCYKEDAEFKEYSNYFYKHHRKSGDTERPYGGPGFLEGIRSFEEGTPLAKSPKIGFASQQ